jgi:hypothetical protein
VCPGHIDTTLPLAVIRLCCCGDVLVVAYGIFSGVVEQFLSLYLSLQRDEDDLVRRGEQRD